MYDISVVRAACRDISREQDPQKAEKLLLQLQAIMKEDREEFRIRVKFLTRKYSHLLPGNKLAD